MEDCFSSCFCFSSSSILIQSPKRGIVLTLSFSSAVLFFLLSANIESDSRGASSTVTPGAAPVEHEPNESAPHLITGDDEGGNEVADEEQAGKAGHRVRAPQTDDEAGVSEPSTSGDVRQRRTRILYPDVNEPSSSRCFPLLVFYLFFSCLSFWA